MRNYLIVILLFLFCLNTSGQTIRFSQTYSYASPDDTARWEGMRSLIEVPGEGYLFPNISTGYFASNNRSKYVITKVDLYGNVIFAKAYGDSLYQHNPESINKISDENYILSDSKGEYATNGLTAGLIKINPSGDTLWTRYYTSGLFRTAGRTAIETSDNGFVVAGWTNNGSGSNSQIYVVKTDNVGNKLWQKQYGGSLQEDCRSIIETPDKGFLIAGWTTSYGGGYMDGFLIKADSIGNLQWQKTYGGTSFAEDIATIIALNDGNYLLTGDKCLGPGLSDNGQGYIVKVDPNGNTIWQKNYGTPDTEGFFATKELSDNSLIIAATSWNAIRNNWDAWLLKLNSIGDTFWSRTYNYPYYNPNSPVYFFDVVPTQDQGFAFGGFAHGPTGTQDAWLLKVDSLGCDTSGCDFGIGVNELNISPQYYKLFPNPNNGNMTFEYELKQGEKGELIIYNSIGQMTNKYLLTVGSNSLQITETEFESGIYFYQQKVNGKIVNSGKLVIVK